MVPFTVFLEPFSECMLAGALASLASYILFRTDPVCFYLVHVLCWFLADWILIHIVQVSLS
jgi:ceramide glucosyltransferase